uniref:Uncharacterized protein n=1 Tax=Corvus moneduloides TaxID=1196302 RepID=A0A8C3EUF1_CORMO
MSFSMQTKTSLYFISCRLQEITGEKIKVDILANNKTKLAVKVILSNYQKQKAGHQMLCLVQPAYTDVQLSLGCVFAHVYSQGLPD